MFSDLIQSLFGPQKSPLYTRFLRLQHRFCLLLPQLASISFGRYLLLTSDSFVTSHPPNFIIALFLFWDRHTHNATQKVIKVRIFKHSSQEWGLGIIHSRSWDHINLAYITSELHSLMSGVKILDRSYISFIYDDTQAHYVTIRKMKGGTIPIQDKFRLQLELPLRLRSVPPPLRLVFLEKGEETLKSIKNLSRELTDIHDFPQLTLSLLEYAMDVLKYLVVLVRVVSTKTSSIQCLQNSLPPGCNLTLEKEWTLEMMDKSHSKQASIFTIELKTSLFLRQPNAIHIKHARRYVNRALENMLGTFRDIHGGLVDQEMQQMALIQSQLRSKNQTLSLIEQLFDVMQPVAMRTQILPETGIALALLLEKTLNIELSEEYHIESIYQEKYHIVIVKTHSLQWRQQLPQHILSRSTHTAYAWLEYEQSVCLCFIHQYPKNDSLLAVIQTALQSRMAHPSSTLRLNFLAGDPPSLNPQLGSDIHCHILYNHLFEGLMRMDSYGVPQPAAAEKFSVSPDQKTYIFYLRHTHWSDGTQLTAHHFEYAWKQAILQHPSPSNRPNYFYPIQGACASKDSPCQLENIGITATHPQVLRVQLHSPCPHFLHLVTLPLYFPALRNSAEPQHFNGPFLISEWQQGHHLLLTKNIYYWNESKNRCPSIHISMIQNPHLAYELFTHRQLDLIGDPICPLPPNVSNILSMSQQPISRVFWLHCNMKNSVLRNKALRQALSYSLDRKQLAQAIVPEPQPSYSPLPEKYSQYKAHPCTPNHSLAHTLLAQALKELHLAALPPLKMIHSSLPFERKLVEALSDQWARHLGIVVNTQELPWDEFSATLDCQKFDLAGLFRRDSCNHPISFLSFFESSLYPWLGWSHDEFNQLFPLSNSPAILARLEDILVNELPVIPLVGQVSSAACHPRVGGVIWEPNGCLNFMETYVDDTL